MRYYVKQNYATVLSHPVETPRGGLLAQPVIRYLPVTKSKPALAARETDTVRNWPKLGHAARPETKRLLDAMAERLGRAAWRIIDDALHAWFATLPESDRAAIAGEIHGVTAEGLPKLVRAEYPPDVAEAVNAFAKYWREPARDEVEEHTRSLLASILKVPVPSRKT
jgi:hypothetical protein